VSTVSEWAERTFPVVRSLRTAEILRLDRIASEGPFPPRRSMTAYWIAVPSRRPDLRTDSRAALIEGLLRSPLVELVDLEQEVGPPPVNRLNNDYAGVQVHLDPAPTGIGAEWVWSALNLDGAGISFADVERGWTVTHEDLQAKMPAAILTHLNDPSRRNHGTAVLGLVLGVDNQAGIVGVAPGVTAVTLASHWDGSSANNVADAIEKVAAVLK
jgi:serine protease